MSLVKTLRENKIYWILPLIIAIIGMAVLVLLGGGEDSPFVYTIF